MASTTAESKLLLLPAEVRMRIFSYILDGFQRELPVCTCDTALKDPPHVTNKIRDPKLSMMLVSKQIAGEVCHFTSASFLITACENGCLQQSVEAQNEVIWSRVTHLAVAVAVPEGPLAISEEALASRLRSCAF